MRIFLLTLLTLTFAIVKPATADIVYSINIDTSSFSGNSGNLDFQFNGGYPSPLAASVKIYNFVSDGALGVGSLTGDVGGGSLPNPVSINNTPGYNDYYTPFTYGNSLAFKLSFSGLAVTAPNPGLGGSAFTFSLLDNAQGGQLSPVLVSQNDGGFAFSVAIGDGSPNPVTNFLSTGSVIAAVPEPEEYAMMLVGAAMIAFQVKRRQRKLRRL